MRQLILLIIAILQRNENAQIMRARYHTDTRAGELCAQLVETPRHDALFGTINVESRNRWVVRCLLCEVRDFDDFVVVAGGAGCAAGGRGAAVVFYGRRCVFDFPVTLCV